MDTEESLVWSSSYRKECKRSRIIRHLESLGNSVSRFSHVYRTGGFFIVVPGRTLVKDVWGDEKAAKLIDRLDAEENRDLVRLGSLPRPQPTQANFIVSRDDPTEVLDPVKHS